MADAKPQEGKAAEKAPDKGTEKSGALKLIIIMVLVLGLDGGLVFVGAKWMAGRKGHGPGAAGGPIATATPENPQTAELLVCKFLADNNKEGTIPLYIDLEVHGLFPEDRKEEAKKALEAHKAEIQDAIRLVIAGAEPSALSEPTLGYVKNGIKSVVDKVLKEELVKKVCIVTWRKYHGR